jgi:hypothetical protein
MMALAARFLLSFAVLVAAQPYLEFLIIPPDGSEQRCAITLIALGAATALWLFIHEREAKDRRDMDGWVEARRRAVLESNSTETAASQDS